MINNKTTVKLLISAGLTAIIVLWSEHHSTINKFLRLSHIEDVSYIVFIFIAAVGATAVVAILVSGYMTRKYNGAMKKVIYLNLIIFGLEILPTFSWILFESELAVWYVAYVGLGLWPVLLLAFLITNVVGIFSIRKSSGRKGIA